MEARDISLSEFATRLGITISHLDELLKGKTKITIELAGTLERLTGISSSFIAAVENRRMLEEKLLKQYGNKRNITKAINSRYCINELKKRKLIKF